MLSMGIESGSITIGEARRKFHESGTHQPSDLHSAFVMDQYRARADLEASRATALIEDFSMKVTLDDLVNTDDLSTRRQ